MDGDWQEWEMTRVNFEKEQKLITIISPSLVLCMRLASII